MKRTPLARGSKAIRRRKPLARAAFKRIGPATAPEILWKANLHVPRLGKVTAILCPATARAAASDQEFHAALEAVVRVAKKILQRRKPMRKGRRKGPAVRFRILVLARAAGRCERCGEIKGSAQLEAHHIVPRARGAGWEGLHEPENGAALCRGEFGCHALVHRHEAPDWADWVKKAPHLA